MAEKTERIKLTTPEFRGSYVSLVKARRVDKDNEEEVAKFGMVIVLDKDLKSTRIFVKKLKAAILEASAAVHGKALDESKMKHYPISDGDDSDNEDFHGHWLIRVSSRFKPQVIDKAGDDLLTEDEIYSGAWYRASVTPYGWKNKFGKGVSIGINSAMKVKDDDKFGGAGSAKDDFKDHLEESDDSDDEDSDDEDDRFS